MDAEDEILEALVQDKITELLESPDSGLHTRESLHSAAKELVQFEKFADGKLNPETLDLAIFTMTKLKRFLFNGQRHLSSAFHPEPELQDLRETDPEQYKLAIGFLERFTIMRLTNRAIEAHHKGCRCTHGPVRLVWNPSASQFIYTH